MGWWSSDKDGHSFAEEAKDSRDQMLWGDEPADVMADAIFRIKIAFMRDLHRLPSVEEVIAGIKFTTNCLAELDGLAQTPRDAQELDARQHDVVETRGWTATGGDQKVSQDRIQAAREIHAVLDELTGQKDKRPTLKAVVEQPQDGPDLQD